MLALEVVLGPVPVPEQFIAQGTEVSSPLVPFKIYFGQFVQGSTWNMEHRSTNPHTITS